MTHRLSAIALLLATLPFGAGAQDECGAQVGATPLVCDQPGYPTGVTYTANGNLVLTFTPSVSEIEANGIRLQAAGTDSITFDSATAAAEIESRETTGALLDVQTESGAIKLLTEEMDADGQGPDAVTHAIRTQSGSGDIDITTTAAVDAASSDNPANSIGIEALSGNGDISITTRGGTVVGNAAGIRAASTGSGAVTIAAEAGVNVGNATGGTAIDATTASGQLVIDVAAGTGQVLGGQTGAAIRASSGSDLALNVAAGRSVGRNSSSSTPLVDLSAQGEITLVNAGSIRAGTTTTVIQAEGSSLSLSNTGDLRGTLQISQLAQGYTFNNGAAGTWQTGGSSNLGAGAISNAGLISLSPRARIDAEGATFEGAGDGTIEMASALLSGSGHDRCEDAQLSGCLNLRGGTTAGVTAIRVQVGSNPDPFADGLTVDINPGLLLVDVGGGSTAAEHFVLAPDSTNYTEDPVYNAVLDTGGLFDYALLYNPELQQHVLTSVPQSEAVEYTAFIDQSLSIWHTTADVVAGRQADLRTGAVGGGWVRISGEQSDRKAAPQATTHGNTFSYSQDVTTYTRAIMAGFDLLSEDHFSLGVHGGLVGASVEPEGSPSVDETTGVTLGAYGGWWAEAGLSLDAALNVNLLKLDHRVRDDLESSSTNVVSLGARVEGGWRFVLGDAFYLQPHLVAAYVSADIERLELRDYDLSFEDSESLRTGLGVRLGGDLRVTEAGTIGYWVTARSWDETTGDGNVQFATEGAPFVIEDDLSGRFEQVDLGVSMGNADGSLTAFLSGGATFADDVDRYSVSFGARLAW